MGTCSHSGFVFFGGKGFCVYQMLQLPEVLARFSLEDRMLRFFRTEATGTAMQSPGACQIFAERGWPTSHGAFMRNQ